MPIPVSKKKKEESKSWLGSVLNFRFGGSEPKEAPKAEAPQVEAPKPAPKVGNTNQRTAISSKPKTETPKVESPAMRRVLENYTPAGKQPQTEAAKVPTPAQKKEEPQDTSYWSGYQGSVPDWMQHLAATGLRVAGTTLGAAAGLATGAPTVIGAIPTAVIGGAVGGGVGGTLAQMVEPGGLSDGLNKGKLASDTIVGGISGPIPWARGAIRGAATGYGAIATDKLLAQGESVKDSFNPLSDKWGPLDYVGVGLGAGVGAASHKLFPPTTINTKPVPTKANTVGTVAPATRAVFDPKTGQWTREAVKTDTGQKVHRVTPHNKTRSPKLSASEQEGFVSEVEKQLGPGAKRMAGQMTARTRADLKAAGLDTRSTTTTPNPIDRGLEADPSDLITTGLPEEMSEATAKALAKAANLRMAPSQITRTRTEAAKALRQEDAAELANINKAMGGSDLRLRDAANANARAKKVEQIQAQDAKNLNKRDAFIKQQQLQDAKNLTAAQKFAQNAENLARIAEERAGRKATDYSIGEGVSGTYPDGTRSSMSRSWVKPKPEVDADGNPINGGGDGGAPKTPKVDESTWDVNKVPSREWIAGTLHTNFQTARKLARKTGAKNVKKVPGGYQVIYDDIKPPTFDTPVKANPEPNGAPKAEMAPGLERDKIAFKRYTNKAEASAIAKATGGTVEQVGPRNYRVRFSEEVQEVAEETPFIPEPRYAKPIASRTKTDLPLTDPTPIPADNSYMGNLTKEEFARYMDISPSYGVKRTPEEIAEFKALHAKKIGQPTPSSTKGAKMAEADKAGEDLDKLLTSIHGDDWDKLPINPAGHGTLPTDAEVPVTPVTMQSGKGRINLPEQQPKPAPEPIAAVDALPPPPGGDVPPEGGDWVKEQLEEIARLSAGKVSPAMGVDEFASKLAAEGDKPIAEVPFSLTPQAAKTKAVEPNMFDAPTPKVDAKTTAQQVEAPQFPHKGTAEDKIAFAQKHFSPEANAELDRLGNAYRLAPNGPEKRQLGQAMAELRDSEIMRLSGKAAPSKMAVETAPGSSKLADMLAKSKQMLEGAKKGRKGKAGAKTPSDTSNDMGGPKKSQLEKNLEEGRKPDTGKTPKRPRPMPNRDQYSKDMAAEIDTDGGPIVRQVAGRKKDGGFTVSAMGAGQLREALRIAEENPEFAAQLLGAVGGAGVGAVMNEEDPLTGAIIGGGVGLGGVSAGRKFAGKLGSGQGKTIKEMMEPVNARIPNYIRGSLLSNPISMTWNSIAGPWGANVLGGIETAAKGAVMGDDRLEMGKDIVKTAHPAKWLKGFWDRRKEATEKIYDVEETGRAGAYVNLENKNRLDDAMMFPAIEMLAGDLNTKGNMASVGVPDELAREMTLTNEPRRALIRGLVNIVKAKSGQEGTGTTSNLAKAMLPFSRTAGNIVESGLERTPIVGSIINYFGDETLKIPMREQLVQQGIGGMVWGLGFAAGQMTDEEAGRAFKIQSLISNLGGQYSLLASAGFMAGQSVRAGQSFSEALDNSAKRVIFEGLPLPSTQPLVQGYNALTKAVSEPTSFEAKDLPGFAIPGGVKFAYNELANEPGSVRNYLTSEDRPRRRGYRPNRVRRRRAEE